MVEFKRPPKGTGGKNPGTFDFLGFTHYWKKSRKGNNVIGRKTMSSRLTRALKRVSEWCRSHRHDKVREQHKNLEVKIIGHYNYYGINGNARCLKIFKHQVERTWQKWLNRRSNRRNLNWTRMRNRILANYPLPGIRIAHSEV